MAYSNEHWYTIAYSTLVYNTYNSILNIQSTWVGFKRIHKVVLFCFLPCWFNMRCKQAACSFGANNLFSSLVTCIIPRELHFAFCWTVFYYYYNTIYLLVLLYTNNNLEGKIFLKTSYLISMNWILSWTNRQHKPSLIQSKQSVFMLPAPCLIMLKF